MGKANLMDVFKEWIGGIAFSVLLWSLDMTKEQYYDAQEKQAIEHMEHPERFE